MCIFDACPYECFSKQEHHSKFAEMRRKLPKEKIEEIIQLSPKVNWIVVKQLKMESPFKIKISI